MSLGIKSSTFLRVGHPSAWKFEVSPQKTKEFELRGPIANFQHFWEKVKPIHPLWDKVFERPGLQQVKEIREKISNRVHRY